MGAMVIDSSLFWLGALGLGIAHAFEPDHMAAVSTFVAGRPSPREAAKFGFQWALGHGFSLLLFGAALFFLKMAVNQPALFASGVLERVVGFVLLCLGLWMVLQLKTGIIWPRTRRGWKLLLSGKWRERSVEEQIIEQQATARLAETDELPLFGAPGTHTTRAAIPGQTTQVVTQLKSAKASRGSWWMGVLHGAAGTGAFVGQAAVTLSQSYVVALLYTMVFSLGVLFAMSFYAGVLGGVLTWGEQRSVRLLHGARWATSLATCAIGLCLINGVELPGLISH
jgi:ABC-type nickel/cobalt efflux system permease component RcnA